VPPNEGANNLSKHGTVIFDVDGTLCDVRSIRYHVDPSEPGYSGKKNFNRFHSDSEWAPVNRWVARLLADLASGGFKIAIVTGREGRWAFLTERWLSSHGVLYDSISYRPDNDERRDSEVKLAHLEALRELDSVVLAVDDNPEVIEMWGHQSVPVVAVASNAEAVKIDVGDGELGSALLKVLKRHRLTT
jgi:FMN phosphatase YigB (HAD superfamily)